MTLDKIFYRPRQLWLALTARPELPDLAEARRLLSAGEMALFERMQPGEQVHSLEVMRKLRRQAGAPVRRELLAAALLHDVGKVKAPLRVWERVLIVIARRLFPLRVKTWGSGEPSGWRRPFVVAQQHPVWGAKLVEQAGASPLVIELVRRHQETPGNPGGSVVDDLLVKLQRVDEDS